MIIKNNKMQVIFVSWFCSFVLIFFVSFAYFLGFKITLLTLLYYILAVLVVVVLCTFVIIMFLKCYHSYTEITTDKIRVFKGTTIIKEIDVKKVKYCVYSSIWNQLLSDPKGGYYRFFYEEDNKDECLFISLTKKQVQEAIKILKIPCMGI